eukprot:CAMPEP_0201283090 /NCGR_PEP_ID=MMETSP1317-20130820/7588_1 /ASSEMBLY_ACC=CAM_ASM_000770 /TAXON_ID=187299 /ORGANISM="Undescribed Undescribed, Strain Undescribed" /LENGTH=58 /DNA_ID=CAMNT_0047598123 /DNA_START=601 /DNA_END=777 /DNA_ORIENTATION=+
MATAAKVTIAEAEEILAPGEIDPNLVQLPGIFVDRLVKGDNYVKPIEKATYTAEDGSV